MLQNDYIYALIEVSTKRKFYIGRTIDPKRRIGEHRLGAKHYKDGDEDKYLYAHQLDKLGIEWDMEIIMECGPGTEFYEDFFVNKFRDEPLQNMRAGDSEPWMGRDYANPEEMLAEKARILAIPKVVKPKRVHECDPDKVLFSFEKPEKRFVAPAIREMMAKRNERLLATKKSL